VLPRKLQDRLNKQTLALRTRTLTHREGIDLSSNDYLGFSQDPVLAERILERLKSYPTGATGSRLLRGNLKIHEETESLLGKFSGREAALLFPSGYQANLGLLSAILSPDDQVFSDELNHASLIDGIRLSKAETILYPHGDIDALRKQLQDSRSQNGQAHIKLIVTESLFSMDGDQAPLPELISLAQEHDALLVVDESHATGLWGSNRPSRPTQGGGLVQSLGLSQGVFATVHTGGKSLGCGGAWIACDFELKEYLINFSRPFIFSTAPSPALAVALTESCRYWDEVGAQRAQEVHRFASTFRERVMNLQAHFPGQLITPPGVGPVIPIILKSNARALLASQALQRAGYDVRAIRPPTVPEGTARLRVTATYAALTHGTDNHSSTAGIPSFDLNRFMDVLGGALRVNLI